MTEIIRKKANFSKKSLKFEFQCPKNDRFTLVELNHQFVEKERQFSAELTDFLSSFAFPLLLIEITRLRKSTSIFLSVNKRLENAKK